MTFKTLIKLLSILLFYIFLFSNLVDILTLIPLIMLLILLSWLLWIKLLKRFIMIVLNFLNFLFLIIIFIFLILINTSDPIEKKRKFHSTAWNCPEDEQHYSNIEKIGSKFHTQNFIHQTEFIPEPSTVELVLHTSSVKE